MVTFSSLELKQNLTKALAVWMERLNEEVPDAIPAPDEWDSEDVEADVSTDTLLDISLNHWDSSAEISCAQFINLVNEFQHSRFIRATGCIGRNWALWRVSPSNQTAYRLMTSLDIIPEDNKHQELLDNLKAVKEKITQLETTLDYRSQSQEQQEIRRELYSAEGQKITLAEKVNRATERRYQINVKHNGHEVNIYLTTGFTQFALHVVDSDLEHEYFPPVASDEAFIEIISDEELREDDSLAFVNAYLFELSATAGAEFTIAPRLEVDEDPFGEFSEDLPPLPNRFRPLSIGKGMAELHAIYNRAISTPDDELRLLCFTKVIEFVSQTVIKRQSTEVIRSKLMCARAIAPDAQFISELEILFDQQRIYKKDREAIRLTVSQCCDAVELARFGPPFIKELLVQNLISDPKAQTTGLNRFADVLYSTRNYIAHAKANYVITGDECPTEQLPKLVECAKIAAEQTIRWFEIIPEPHKVI